MGQLFLSELAGTTVMMTIGVGVTMNVNLLRTKGHSGGYLMGAFGWALGVYAGVYLAGASGAHLNPAVTLAKVLEGSGELAPGVAVDAATVAVFVAAQLAGAMLGATLAWLAYRDHFRAGAVKGGTVTVFATSPQLRSAGQNFLTEVIATFLLVLVILRMGDTPSGLGPLGVAMLVLGVGLGIGGPTGWSINPARDLGARIAHALLPVAGKGDSDWSYAWVPVVGPLVGAGVAVVVAGVMA